MTQAQLFVEATNYCISQGFHGGALSGCRGNYVSTHQYEITSSLLPAGSGVTAVSAVAGQLTADAPELLAVLAGVIAVMSVMRLLHRWMFEGTKPATGGAHVFAGSDPGGSTKWGDFERRNQEVISDADEAIAENRRLMRKL